MLKPECARSAYILHAFAVDRCQKEETPMPMAVSFLVIGLLAAVRVYDDCRRIVAIAKSWPAFLCGPRVPLVG